MKLSILSSVAKNNQKNNFLEREALKKVLYARMINKVAKLFYIIHISGLFNFIKGMKKLTKSGVEAPNGLI